MIWGKMTRSESARLYRNSTFIFSRNLCTAFYRNQTKNLFPPTLIVTTFSLSFSKIPPFVVISHCHLDKNFPDTYGTISTFHICTDYLYNLFWKSFCFSPLPKFYEFIEIFCCVMRFLCLGYYPFINKYAIFKAISL